MMEATRDTQAPADAERRQLTVMFLGSGLQFLSLRAREEQMLQRDAHCADLPIAVSGAPRSAILVPLYRSTARGYQGDGLSRARG